MSQTSLSQTPLSQTRIGRLFERLRAEGRPGLIAYITAGDPSPERTPALESAHAVAETLRRAPAAKNELFVINLSGRGDKDTDIYRENLKELDEPDLA